MANRTVSIWKYVKIGNRWRYCRPATSPNGKIKPDVVIVNDSHQYHPEGNYYIHFLRALIAFLTAVFFCLAVMSSLLEC